RASPNTAGSMMTTPGSEVGTTLIRSLAAGRATGPAVDPERASPRKLAVVLDRPNVVPAQAGIAGFLVGPLEAGALGAGLGRVDVAEVLDDVDPGDRPRAVDQDAQPDRSAGLELVTHQVLTAPDVHQNIVGRGVAVPLLEGVEDRRAAVVLRDG